MREWRATEQSVGIDGRCRFHAALTLPAISEETSVRILKLVSNMLLANAMKANTLTVRDRSPEPRSIITPQGNGCLCALCGPSSRPKCGFRRHASAHRMAVPCPGHHCLPRDAGSSADRAGVTGGVKTVQLWRFENRVAQSG